MELRKINTGFAVTNENIGNLIFKSPNSWSTDRKDQYYIVENKVEFIWTGFKKIGILYKGAIIDGYIPTAGNSHIASFGIACDFLNMYSKKTETELDELLEKRQQKEKSKLEEAIEQLKIEKSELESKISLYKSIEEKRKELNNLIEQL